MGVPYTGNDINRDFIRIYVILATFMAVITIVPHAYGLEPAWIYRTGGQDISSMAISADGSTIAIGTSDGGLILLDSAGTEQWRQKLPGEVLIAIPPDGSLILAGTREDHYKNKGALRLYEKNGTQKWFINTGFVTGIGISADRKRMAAGVQTGDIYLTTAEGTTPTVIPPEKDTVMAQGFAMSPDGSTGGYTKFLVNDRYVTRDPRLVIINLNSKSRKTCDIGSDALAFISNGSIAASGISDGTTGSVSVYQRDGKLICRNEIGAVSDVAISGSGDRIAGTSWSGLSLLTVSGNASRLLLPREDLTSVSMNRNGTFIATGSTDGTVYFLNWTGTILWSNWNGGVSPGKIVDVALAADGNAVVSASDQHEVWYFRTGVLDVPPTPVNSSTPAANTTGKAAGVTPAGNKTGSTMTGGPADTAPTGTVPASSPEPTKAAAGILPLLAVAVGLGIGTKRRRNN